MTELDKFKRRTIRSVARLLRQKKPPDELWGEMKKETGTDCRVLWERMRALCIKKLNRMLAADDRSSCLPSIARLSLTDWLLVDLVLVHEKIDVIATDKVDNKAEQKPLVQLFNLVQKFDVEGRAGEPLAEAWAAATFFYNQQGRQCSPMLLQRRWYQLKKLTRCRFYRFWQTYRGNTRLLAEAKGTMPTRLQMAVAKRYPTVITGEFPEWEELIELKLIILPEEFESKMRIAKPKPSSDPDLVVVEPVIETIELGEDSDSEEHKIHHNEDSSDPEKSNDAPAHTKTYGPPSVKVKSEPIEEDGLSNVQVIATTHVTELEIPDESPEHNSVSGASNENQISAEDNVCEDDTALDSPELYADSPEVNDESPNQPENSETNVEQTINRSDSDDDVIEIPIVVPSIDIDPETPTKAPAEEVAPVISSVSTATQKVPDEVDDILKSKADEYCRKDAQQAVPTNFVDDLIKDKVETFLKTTNDDMKSDEKKPDVSAINLNANAVDVTAIDLMADLNFNDDGLEFIDDGVEFVEEMIQTKTEPVTSASPDVEGSNDSDDNNKFDLKLLMDPVIYTTKLDHMKIFTNKSLGSVNSKDDIEKIVAESKPVSKKSFNLNVKQDTASQNDDTNTVEDMGINDDLFTNEESDDDMTVSPTSYMLKKPKTRSYNPIQLCKNPDFNTKLRRLAIGFFSSPRNRQLLNACIPMTIDVSKGFESKLVDGTLYLKSTGAKPPVVEEPVIEKEAFTSVMPSALPMQSLLDTSKTNILELIPPPTIDLTPTTQNDPTPTPTVASISPPAIDVFPEAVPISDAPTNPVVAERQKIINLPDIDKVRKINQKLLTAQVPPIRVYAGPSHRPPVTKTDAVTSQVEPVKHSGPAFIAMLPPQPGNLPTIVKVESGAKEILDSNTNVPSDTFPPAKQKLIQIINQAKLSTQEALTKIDGDKNTMMTDVLKFSPIIRPPGPNKPNVPKKQLFSRISVPWNKRRIAPRSGNLDEFLITGDTLNKMLHLMGGNDEEKDCACCSRKLKKQEWNKADRIKKKKEMLEKNAQKNESAGDTESVEGQAKNSTENTSEPPKAPIAKGRVVRYCCWARQKLNKRKRMTKHECKLPNCTCCCRDALAKYFEDTAKAKPIELSDDDDKSLKTACESIEKVVQESRQSAAENVVSLASTSGQKLVLMRSMATSTDQQSSEWLPTVKPVNQPEAPILNVPDTQPMPINELPTPVITQIIPPSELMNLFSSRKKPVNKPKPQHCVQTPNELRVVPCSCRQSTGTGKPQLSIVIDSSRNIVLDASSQCRLHPPPPPPPPLPHPLPPIAPAPPVPTTSRIVEPVVPSQKDSKVLYLHSKSIAKSPSESPIFLGKNKILLTTVKLPRKEEQPVLPECPVFQAPKIIPTLPLPTGVQLVLLPTGNVTYTVEPGVELTEEQLAVIPTILAAVQEQLNSSPLSALSPIVSNVSGVTSNDKPDSNVSQSNLNTPKADVSGVENSEAPHYEKIDLTANKIVANTGEIDKTENTDSGLNLVPKGTDKNIVIDAEVENTVAPVSNDNETIPAQTQSDNTEIQNEKQSSNLVTAPEMQIGTLPSSELGPAVETQLVTQSDTSVIANAVTEAAIQNSDSVDNRKTLLSDLMEMSGISAEDAAAAEPASTEKTTHEQVPMLVNSVQTTNLPELTPVTSFVELKFACDNGGKFFKLDMETGVIVPINVCIKKNPKPKARAKVKAVIDLTDDMDDSNESVISKEPEPLLEVDSFANRFKQYVYKGKTLTVASTPIKPVKMFKAVRAVQTKRHLEPFSKDSDTIHSKKYTAHLQKRKQTFSKVDTVLDLVDSDTPMEEEYLMESSSDNESSQAGSEPMMVEALEDLDYSSDDEPLAMKSKRMKVTHENSDVITETNVPNAVNVPVTENAVPESNVAASDVTKTLNIPMESEDSLNHGNNDALSNNDVQPVLGPQNEPPPASEAPEMDEDEDDPDLDPNVDPELRFLSISSDNEGGEEEDCILGV